MPNMIVEALSKAGQLITGSGDYAGAAKLIEEAGKLNSQVIAITNGGGNTRRVRAGASGTASTEVAVNQAAPSNTAVDTSRQIFDVLAQHPAGLTRPELFAAVKDIAPNWREGTLQTQLNRWAGSGCVRVEGDRFYTTGKVPERGRPRRAA